MSEVRFWAKTGQGKFRDNGQPEYHPVICHLADGTGSLTGDKTTQTLA